MLGQFPGNNTRTFSISEYCYLEIDKFPGNNTWKLYPEVALKKFYFREYLGENKNIFENI